MTDLEGPAPRSRRTVLLAGLGGVAAGVAAGLGRPAPVEATTGTMVYGTIMSEAGDSTELRSNGGGVTFSAVNFSSGTGLQGQTQGVSSIGVYGQSDAGYGVLGDTGMFAIDGVAGTWGRDWTSSSGKVGAAGTSLKGTGLSGVAGTGTNSVAPPAALGSNGLPELTGVYGFAASGVGVRASSTTGTALKVTGKASFSRSGKVNFPANATYIDITPPGGLSGTPLCFANLMEFRAGVYVAAVRPNWPTAGKLRIYLNKAASTTVSTPLAWNVLG